MFAYVCACVYETSEKKFEGKNDVIKYQAVDQTYLAWRIVRIFKSKL